MNCRDSRPCMETKTFCRCCKTHFYKPEMRGRIRMAICCGGLRMLLYHLLLWLRYVCYGKAEKDV